MNRKFLFTLGLFLASAFALRSQTIYVDAVKGRYEAKGSITDPFSKLEQAVALTNGFTGVESVTIKVAPGLYSLQHLLELKTRRAGNDTCRYTIEASIMPDDPEWTPLRMPVIQSFSSDNTNTQFTHCAGILVSKNNVSLQGLKFLGNANPAVRYYYPVTRENENYKGLEISQCYFIGEKNSSAIQGAIWAHGAGIKVDHSIFYECKNALLLFRSISDFSVTHSIIYGSYEAAVWFGPFNSKFVFQNNIVSNCNYFWLRPENTKPAYEFSNSVITENAQYLGHYTQNGLVPAKADSIKEVNLVKTGKVQLSEVKTEGLPADYLNVMTSSVGKDLSAGIFKTRK